MITDKQVLKGRRRGLALALGVASARALRLMNLSFHSEDFV